jgi:hypothetical protein
MTELPEKDTDDPPNRVVIKTENLCFNDIPTLIATVRFELKLNDKPSLHSRLEVKTRKGFPANSFINEYNLLEKKLEKCCKEFDKIKKKTSDSR